MSPTWMTIWSTLFWLVLGAFSVLAVAVSWGGIGDLRELFRALDEEHARGEEEDPS